MKDNHKELIERLRTESLYKDKATLEIMDLCMEAADALAVLQAKYETLARYAAEKYTQCDAMGKENARLCAELEQVKRERDAAEEFLGSIVRNSTNPCEGCKADCIDAGSDDAEYSSQCGMFEWRGPQEDQ